MEEIEATAIVALKELIRRIVREELAAQYIAQPSKDADELLTVREVAFLKRVSTRSVYDWVAKNLIPHKRTPGGQLRFKRRDVEKM